MLNRQFAPGIKDAIEFNLELKPYQKYQLRNGVNVYAVDAGAEEVVQLEIVFYAGNWYEEKNLVAVSTNHLLKNGTTAKSAFAINDHFEYYGSYLNRNCYNETSTVTLHSLSKHVPALLPVVRELITDSVFPQEELDIFKQNMKQKLEVNLKKCDFVANRLIDDYLFGHQHPYGRYSSTLAFDALQRAELKQYFDRYYLNGHAVIFAAGKFPEGFFNDLERFFGDLPLNKTPLPVIHHPIESSEEKKFRIMNDNNGVQGAIRMARHFPNRHHPDFPKAQVLNNIFGGFFGSRLMTNIREDKGYTYGIHSYLQNHLHNSAWMVSTEAGREVCEATITEVYKEMEILRNEKVDDEELLLVKNYMMGSVLGELDGPFQIIARWKNIILNNLDENYFVNSIQAIKSITASELQELADRYFQPREFYELVVI
jgi:zinc protease